MTACPGKKPALLRRLTRCSLLLMLLSMLSERSLTRVVLTPVGSGAVAVTPGAESIIAG